MANSADWVFLEGGGAPGAVAISVPEGDHPRPYMLRVTSPVTATDYTVTVSGEDPCRYPAAQHAATYTGWAQVASGGSLPAGSAELLPVTFDTAYTCGQGAYGRTITVTAPGRVDQLITLILTVGAPPTNYTPPGYYFDFEGDSTVNVDCFDSHGLEANINRGGGTTIECESGVLDSLPYSTKSARMSGVAGNVLLDTDPGETGAWPNVSSGKVSIEFAWELSQFNAGASSPAEILSGRDSGGNSGGSFSWTPSGDTFQVATDGGTVTDSANPSTATANSQVHFSRLEIDLDADTATLTDDIQGGDAPGTGGNVSLSADGTATGQTLDGWMLGTGFGGAAIWAYIDDLRITFGPGETNHGLEAFGDSLTAGGAIHETKWSKYLPWRFGHLRDNAVGGRTSAQVKTDIDAAIAGGLDSTRMVALNAGTNDSSQGVSTATFTANIQAAVDALQLNGNSRIVIIGPPHRYEPASFSGCGDNKSACDTIIDDYTTAMEGIATAESIGFVSLRDVYAAMRHPEMCFSDGVHPDAGPCADFPGQAIGEALEALRP